jgi:hypothetical protein
MRRITEARPLGAGLAAYRQKHDPERKMRHIIIAFATLVGVVMIAAGSAHGF